MNQDQRITEIHTDIKWIREKIDKINGKVQLNTAYRVGCEAKGSLIRWAVGGGWMLTLVTLILYIVKR